MVVLLIAAVLPMIAVRAVQAVSVYRLQSQVAQQMRETGDASTALHRVWWMVRP